MTSMKLNLKNKLNNQESDILAEEGYLRNSYERRKRPTFGHYNIINFGKDFKYYDLHDMKPEVNYLSNNKKVREARLVIKDNSDLDVLELRKKKWNSLTTNDKTLQKKPELKQTLFEVENFI